MLQTLRATKLAFFVIIPFHFKAVSRNIRSQFDPPPTSYCNLNNTAHTYFSFIINILYKLQTLKTFHVHIPLKYVRYREIGSNELEARGKAFSGHSQEVKFIHNR